MIVDNFSGTFSQQVRIVGATAKPASIPYRANMTLLDAMIAVGGLSEFASGNKARLIRFDRATGKQAEYALRIGRLLKQGDASANVALHRAMSSSSPKACSDPYTRQERLERRARMNGLYDELKILIHGVWRQRWLALAVAWGVAFARLAGDRADSQQL